MNWKEYPQLFANGKFHILFDSGFEKLNPRKLIGIKRSERVWVILQTINSDKISTLELEYSTLIARPISSMTDEEKCSLRDPSLGYMVAFNCSKGEGWFYSQGYEQMLYLLSIGVYPFNQSDFKTGTVIDLTTLI